MKRITICLGLVASQLVFGTQVWGQATCDIDPRKRQVIESVLCGQTSPDKAYHHSGAGCFERSVNQTLADSAAQIFMFEKCVDSKFALELQEATVEAMEFMEDLSVCVEEDVDLDKVLQDKMAFIRKKGSTLDCSIRIKSQLYQRRPAFEAMIAQINDDSRAKIFQKLGVKIDANGNISDY